MIFRYLPLGASILIFGLAFSNVVVAQMDFSFPAEKVPVLKVEEYYDEANKEKRPMLLVYPDGRVVRPVSTLRRFRMKKFLLRFLRLAEPSGRRGPHLK